MEPASGDPSKIQAEPSAVSQGGNEVQEAKEPEVKGNPESNVQSSNPGASSLLPDAGAEAGNSKDGENPEVTELKPEVVEEKPEGSLGFLKMADEEFQRYLKPVETAADPAEKETFSSETLLYDLVLKNTACIFLETGDLICDQAVTILKSLNLDICLVRMDKIDQSEQIKELLFRLIKRKNFPVIFLKAQLIGGYEELWYLYYTDLIQKVLKEKELTLVNNFNFQYEMIVVGGGIAGITAALEAARLGRKVALVDCVDPTLRGKACDIGGTCINAGTLTKNFLIQASQYGRILEGYGVEGAHEEHPKWTNIMISILDYIKSVNFATKAQLKEAGVTLYNAVASFETPHSLKLRFPSGEPPMTVASAVVVIATGCKPRVPRYILNLDKIGSTTDDFLRCTTTPRRALVITSNYVGLELAIILASVRIETTLLVEQPILDEIDWEFLKKSKTYMKHLKIEFQEGLQIESIENAQTEVFKIKVVGLRENKIPYEGYFDTVIYDYGRIPNTAHMGLSKIGIKVDKRSRKIIVDSNWKTSISHIFAIGDVVHGWPEQSSVAKKTGKCLIERIYLGNLKDLGLKAVPVRIMLHAEYARLGLTEQAAIKRHGRDGLRIYHGNGRTLGLTTYCPVRSTFFLKVVCLLEDKEEDVIGIHLMCEGAAELIQGIAMLFRNGLKKKDLEDVLQATFCEILSSIKLELVKTCEDVLKASQEKEVLTNFEKTVDEAIPLRGKTKAPQAEFDLDERGQYESKKEMEYARNRELSTLEVLGSENVIEATSTVGDSSKYTSFASSSEDGTDESSSTSSSGGSTSTSTSSYVSEEEEGKQQDEGSSPQVCRCEKRYKARMEMLKRKE